MIVESLTLENWMRYAGEHRIAFAPLVYAVTARFDHDERRSNWAGKTSLLEAIRFALYGAHRAAREDEWITRGERHGAVEVLLSGPVVIRRERRVGSATKLVVTLPDGALAQGDDAQKFIAQWVGLSLADFDATCWMGQKQLSRFVLARPGERFEIVSGWAGLAPLQRCEERARLRLSEQTAKLAALDARVASEEAAVASVRVALGLPGATAEGVVRERLVCEAQEAERAVNDWRVVLDDCDAQMRAAAERAAFARAQAERDQVMAQLRDARAEFEALPDVDVADAMRAAGDARLEMQTAGADVKAKGALARGEFDGRCPVGGIECPATKVLNDQRRENAALHKRALTVYDDACRAEALARSAHEDALRVGKRRDTLLGQREAMRVRLALLKDELADKPDDGPPAAEVQAMASSARSAFERAATEHARAQAEVRAFDAHTDALQSLNRDREKVEGQVRLLRSAVRVFGRQGAQQRVAEVALDEIQRGANALLSDAGIELTVTMRWAREASAGLAASCDACGAPHPASQRVKACERCGAARGPKLVERLDVELSDRSGAAEDLAGAAVQLAAGAWLRRERDVQWSVAMIDEPFGALDEANRRLFASHLVKMLKGAFGFEQSFIVAHSPDVLDAMPGRVVVTADDYGSKAEVV